MCQVLRVPDCRVVYGLELFVRESGGSFGEIDGCRNFSQNINLFSFSPGFVSTTVLCSNPYSWPLFKIRLSGGVRIYVPAMFFDPLSMFLSLKSNIRKVANVTFQFLDATFLVFRRWFPGVHKHMPYCVLFGSGATAPPVG